MLYNSFYLLMVAVIVLILIILSIFLTKDKQNVKIVAIYDSVGNTQIEVPMIKLLKSRNYPDVIYHDIKGNVDNIDTILEEYYRKGNRAYIGFARSELLERAVPFFNRHKDVIGISIGSTATVLRIPDNIYRISMPDVYSVQAIKNYVKTKQCSPNCSIKVLAESVDAWAQSMSNDIMSAIPNTNILEVDVNKTPIDQVKNFVHNADLIINLFSSKTQEFYQKYTDILSPDIIAGDGSSGSEFPPNIRSSLIQNKYKTVQYYGLSTPLVEQVDHNSFIASIIDAYTIASSFLQKKKSPVIGETGYLTLDKYGDRVYGQVTMTQLQPDNSYLPVYLYGDDPYLGEYFTSLTHNI